MELKQIQRQTPPPMKLTPETAARVKREIVKPAFEKLNLLLADLYADIVEAVELPEAERERLNDLLNLQGATNPLWEQVKEALIF